MLKTRPLATALITARPTSEHSRPDFSEKATREALDMKSDSYAAGLLLGRTLQIQNNPIAAEHQYRRALDV